MPSYTITEPHPTVPKNSYTHSGRGGAGNFFRAPETTAPSGVPTPAVSAPASSSTRFYSGRGGAGNIHSASERQTISFDEEFQRAEVREKTATITHVGRGGAGNIFSSLSGSKEGSTRRDSESTTGSTKSGFWGRLSSVGHQRRSSFSNTTTSANPESVVASSSSERNNTQVRVRSSTSPTTAPAAKSAATEDADMTNVHQHGV